MIAFGQWRRTSYAPRAIWVNTGCTDHCLRGDVDQGDQAAGFCCTCDGWVSDASDAIRIGNTSVAAWAECDIDWGGRWFGIKRK